MSPEQLSRLSQPVVDIYNKLESDILEDIASNLKDNKDILETDAEAWKIQMADNLGILEQANLERVRDMAGLTNSEINGILYDSGMSGLRDSEKVIQELIKNGANLLTVGAITDNPTIIDILESYERQAKNTLNLVNQTMLEGSKQIYTDILNQVSIEVSSGFTTGTQAVRKSINKWADAGIPVLVDKAGRRWGPEGYVRMVMRSTANNVVEEMQTARFDEYRIELCEVSAHAGARPKCAPYQGRVFSLKPNHPKYMYIGDTSYGLPDGLFGINCGHIRYPYVEGISEKTYKPYPQAENDRIYKESQEQRYHERQIRKAKNRQKMLNAAGDSEGAKRAGVLVRNRQAKIRGFIDKTGRTRRYNREQIYG